MTAPSEPSSSSSSCIVPAPDAAIFVPIDLEASLGRIEDHPANFSQQHGQQEQEQGELNQRYQCGGSVSAPATPGRTKPTRTLSKAPSQAQHIIAPFPVVETPDELNERQKLTSTIFFGFSSSVLSNNSSGGTLLSSPIHAPPLFAAGIDLCLPNGDDDDGVDRDDDDCMLDRDEDMVVSRHDLDLVTNDEDGHDNNVEVDDDFSLSEEEAHSLQDEDLYLDSIQHDPVSFWEAPTASVEEEVSSPSASDPSQRLQQELIPDSVSFSSQAVFAGGMDWR
jgi:hypothetical protein